MLNGCQYAKDVFDLEAVRINWINLYSRVHGKTDGPSAYERERVLYVGFMAANATIGNCDRFSIYKTWMDLALAGISLANGQAAIIPRGGKATLHIQWQGRREQMMQLPQVVHIEEPVVVYDCDHFDFHRDMNGLHINIHKPLHPRPADAKRTCVYVTIQYTYGVKAHMMDAGDVLTIRDNYSDSYKRYLEDLKHYEAARAANPNHPEGKVQKTGKNGNTWWADLEAPMWVNREDEAWKKTMIHRLYKNVDKLPHQKYLDERITAELEAQGVLINEYDEMVGKYDYDDVYNVPGAEGNPQGAGSTGKTGGRGGKKTPPATPPAQPAATPVQQPAVNAQTPAQQQQPVQQTPPVQQQSAPAAAQAQPVTDTSFNPAEFDTPAEAGTAGTGPASQTGFDFGDPNESF